MKLRGKPMNKFLGVNIILFSGVCTIVQTMMINSVKASQSCYLVDANNKVVNLGFVCNEQPKIDDKAQTVTNPTTNINMPTPPSGNTNINTSGGVSNTIQQPATNSSTPSNIQRRIPLIRTN